MAQLENYPTIFTTPKSVMNSFACRALVSLKAVSIATSLFFTSTAAYALGLGVLDVRSNLDQPLDGVISVNVAPGDDTSALTAEVASREEFEALGVDYPDYLNNIILNLEQGSQGLVLRVSSNGVVIKEPFIHFLVKVNWSGGNFLREYTALIDPPVYAAETPKAVSKPKSVGTDQSYNRSDSSVNEVSVNEVVEEYQEPDNQEQSYSASETTVPSTDYDNESGLSGSSATDARYGPVAAGESLSLIAQELQRQVPDLSIYAIMKILHEDNPDAFIDGNINGLIKGAVLNVRDINQIRQVDINDARRFFAQQVQDWSPSTLTASADDSNLRVGQDTYGSDSELFGSASSYSGNDSNSDSTSFQVGASSDTNTFVSGAQGETNEGEMLALRQEISELQTSLASSNLENQELTERISLLEGQLSDMNRLMSLSVEDADLASLEATLASQNSDGINVSEEVVDAEVDAVEDFINDAAENGVEIAESADDLLDSTDDLLNEFLDDSSEVIESSSDSLTEVADSGTDSVVEEVSKPVATPTIQQPQYNESMLDKIGGIAPIAGGLGVLLLGGAGLYFVRRRRADEEFEISMLSIESNSQSIGVDTDSGLSASMSASLADSLSDNVDSAASEDKETSFLTVYSDSDAVVQADEVDPIAEADVYIAYGRDEQAEEVLLDGIAANPERVDVKRKLIGLYYKNKNSEGFERVAEELFTYRDSMSGDDWQEVSDMGQELSPDNPLFSLSGSDFDAVDKSADAQTEAPNQAPTQESSTAVEASPEQESPAQEVDFEEALVFDTVDETPEDDALEMGVEAQKTVELEGDSISELMIDSINDDASVQLVNFDEDRSEISQLDEVQLDVLDLDDGDEDVLQFDLSDSGDIDDDLSAEIDISTELSFGDSTDEPNLAEDDLVLDFDSIDNETKPSNDSGYGDIPEVSDLVIDPDYDEAQTQYELAKVFVDLGDEDGAKKILEELVADQNNSAEIIKNSQELLDSMNS